MMENLYWKVDLSFGPIHLGDEAVAVRKAIAKRYGLTYKLFTVYLFVSGLFKKKDHLPETNIVFELEN